MRKKAKELTERISVKRTKKYIFFYINNKETLRCLNVYSKCQLTNYDLIATVLLPWLKEEYDRIESKIEATNDTIDVLTTRIKDQEIKLLQISECLEAVRNRCK